MSTILVIQHVESEGLGIMDKEIERLGFSPYHVRIYKNAKVPHKAPAQAKGVIILGGPMGVYEDAVYPFIKDELRLIESALKGDLPVLGVCLGSQLLAKAAGARVYKGRTKEIGWHPVRLTGEGSSDALFLGMPEEINVFQWHGDTFDVPDNAVNLATSKLFENQAIRVGKNAYGLQFHLEVTGRMIADWIRVNSAELKPLKGTIDPEAILKETPKEIPGLQRHGRVVVARFLRLLKPACQGSG